MHWPSSENLTPPWGWGWRAVHLSPHESVTWPVSDALPESSAITQWKWAVLWTSYDGSHDDLDHVTDIDFQVEDTCAGNATIVGDHGYDLRARFRLDRAQISGRCLQMRATAFSVPPAGVTFYSADYFHSGPPTEH
jgi:hypothetical protein